MLSRCCWPSDDGTDNAPIEVADVFVAPAPYGHCQSLTLREDAAKRPHAIDYTPGGLPIYFPLYALPIHRIQGITSLMHHELVEPLVWEQSAGPLGIVSHQWTSWSHPDHTGEKFDMLQETLASIHEVVDKAHRDFPGKMQTLPNVLSQEEADSLHIWLDFWSIPQKKSEDLQKAIRSIPAYVASARIFFALVPPVAHRELRASCDLASWRNRGWCRLEFTAFHSRKYRVGAAPPLYVIKGSRECELCLEGQIAVVKPEKSIFNGEFTCCARKHKIEGKDTLCDKARLVEVVADMSCGQLSQLETLGDLQTWRKTLALQHRLFAGSHYRPPAAGSVEEFLEKYKMPHAAAQVEGGMTPLHYAVYEDDSDMVRLLVQAGADMEVGDTLPAGKTTGIFGVTPLYLAALSACNVAAAALLEAGASTNSRIMGGEGPTPLCVAAGTGNAELVALLLAHGAEVDLRSGPKLNDKAMAHLPPLFFAAGCILVTNEAGAAEATRLLLEAGADPTLRCSEGEHRGRLALDVARLKERKNVAGALLKYMPASPAV